MARPPRKSGHGRPDRRRMPPPEATGFEQRYLDQQQRRGRPVILRLRDGGSLRGTIADHDTDQVTIVDDDRRSIVLRKSQIRLLQEDG